MNNLNIKKYFFFAVFLGVTLLGFQTKDFKLSSNAFSDVFKNIYSNITVTKNNTSNKNLDATENENISSNINKSKSLETKEGCLVKFVSGNTLLYQASNITEYAQLLTHEAISGSYDQDGNQAYGLFHQSNVNRLFEDTKSAAGSVDEIAVGYYGVINDVGKKDVTFTLVTMKMSQKEYYYYPLFSTEEQTSHFRPRFQIERDYVKISWIRKKGSTTPFSQNYIQTDVGEYELFPTIKDGYGINLNYLENESYLSYSVYYHKMIFTGGKEDAYNNETTYENDKLLNINDIKIPDESFATKEGYKLLGWQVDIHEIPNVYTLEEALMTTDVVATPVFAKDIKPTFAINPNYKGNYFEEQVKVITSHVKYNFVVDWNNPSNFLWDETTWEIDKKDIDIKEYVTSSNPDEVGDYCYDFSVYRAEDYAEEDLRQSINPTFDDEFINGGGQLKAVYKYTGSSLGIIYMGTREIEYDVDAYFHMVFEDEYSEVAGNEEQKVYNLSDIVFPEHEDYVMTGENSDIKRAFMGWVYGLDKRYIITLDSGQYNNFHPEAKLLCSAIYASGSTKVYDGYTASVSVNQPIGTRNIWLNGRYTSDILENLNYRYYSESDPNKTYVDGLPKMPGKYKVEVIPIYEDEAVEFLFAGEFTIYRCVMGDLKSVQVDVTINEAPQKVKFVNKTGGTVATQYVYSSKEIDPSKVTPTNYTGQYFIGWYGDITEVDGDENGENKKDITLVGTYAWLNQYVYYNKQSIELKTNATDSTKLSYTTSKKDSSEEPVTGFINTPGHYTTKVNVDSSLKGIWEKDVEFDYDVYYYPLKFNAGLAGSTTILRNTQILDLNDIATPLETDSNLVLDGYVFVGWLGDTKNIEFEETTLKAVYIKSKNKTYNGKPVDANSNYFDNYNGTQAKWKYKVKDSTDSYTLDSLPVEVGTYSLGITIDEAGIWNDNNFEVTISEAKSLEPGDVITVDYDDMLVNVGDRIRFGEVVWRVLDNVKTNTDVTGTFLTADKYYEKQLGQSAYNGNGSSTKWNITTTLSQTMHNYYDRYVSTDYLLYNGNKATVSSRVIRTTKPTDSQNKSTAITNEYIFPLSKVEVENVKYFKDNEARQYSNISYGTRSLKNDTKSTVSIVDSKGFTDWSVDQTSKLPLRPALNFNLDKVTLYVIEVREDGTVTFAVNYNVTFDENNGVFAQNVKNIVKGFPNESVEFSSAPTRTNYEFAGWTTTKDDKNTLVDTFDNITFDITYYALWNKNFINVRYLGYDDVVLKTQSITTKEELEFPVVPEVEGNIFVGWLNKDREIGNEDVDFKAIYITKPVDMNTNETVDVNREEVDLEYIYTNIDTKETTTTRPTQTGTYTVTVVGGSEYGEEFRHTLDGYIVISEDGYKIMFVDYNNSEIDKYTQRGVKPKNVNLPPNSDMKNEKAGVFMGWLGDTSKVLTEDVTMKSIYINATSKSYDGKPISVSTNYTGSDITWYYRKANSSGDYTKGLPVDVGEYELIADIDSSGIWSDISNEGVKASITLNAEDTNTDTSDDEEYPTIPVYRMYNHVSGEHLFTTKYGEYNKLLKHGWIQEGLSFDGYAEQYEGTVPVYRIYDPKAYLGDHHYTKSLGEATKRVNNDGWEWDNHGLPIFYTSGEYTVYKLYFRETGRHHYTPKEKEASKLEALGWEIEGTAWDGVGYYTNTVHYYKGKESTNIAG